MKRLSRICLASVCILAVWASGHADGRKQATTIPVLVYNYAEVPRTILATAERQAFRILGAAGVRVLWVDCLEKFSTIDSKELCESGWSAQTPGVRLLSGHITDMYKDREFGFAAIPVLATVNYKRITDRYGRDDTPDVFPVMLGCLIAHELGHLLLRDPGHSTTGIMQPQWGDEQVRQALTGGLWFTSQQAILIQEHALSLSAFRSGIQKQRWPPPGDPSGDALRLAEPEPGRKTERNRMPSGQADE